MAEKPAFRRSIWKDDPRYFFGYSDLTAEECNTIARLAWINAAKISVAPRSVRSYCGKHGGIGN